jgi:hypothetical protein
MSCFWFSYEGPQPSSVIAMWAQLTGMTQNELLNAILQGTRGKPDLSELNLKGPKGTVETEVGYARTLLNP